MGTILELLFRLCPNWKMWDAVVHVLQSGTSGMLGRAGYCGFEFNAF